MARKVTAIFEATLKKNPEKGGAWLASVSVRDEGIDEGYVVEKTAWSNASAGKRWVKERVQAMTTRKSCKMIAGADLDVKGKPMSWSGTVSFKREA
jgi:hypothetical protein